MKQLLRRWMSLFNAPPQGVPTPPTPTDTGPLLDQCHRVYQALDVAVFADYTRSRGVQKKLTVVHPTIGACIADLREHIDHLDRVGHISDTRAKYTAMSRNLNRFFLDSEGNYLTSVRNTLEELVQVMGQLYTALDQAKQTHPETQSYNLRMLNALLYVMLELGHTLTDISQEISHSR